MHILGVLKVKNKFEAPGTMPIGVRDLLPFLDLRSRWIILNGAS